MIPERPGRTSARRFDIAPGELFLPAAVALCVLFAAAAGEPARLVGRYERAAVLEGELWRLASAHFVHLGWPHALLNLAGLGLVYALFAPALAGWRGLCVLFVSLLAIDAGFLLGEPGLAWYVGFSGALHGLFAAGVVAGLAARERDAWLLGALLMAKLGAEQLFGAVPLSETLAGGPVVESAHLYGALGGVLASGLLALRPRAGRL
jgi:rhomboid family GlyGly-CTERM serine protease